MEESLETGEMQLNIPFDQQLQVYNQLSDSVIPEIWSLEAIQVYGDSPQDTFRTIQISLEGKYFEFLKETAKEDKLAKNYYDAISAAGDISPSLIHKILAYYDDYNTQDIRVKLIIAIHYLTLNDIFERKEKINKTVANKS